MKADNRTLLLNRCVLPVLVIILLCSSLSQPAVAQNSVQLRTVPDSFNQRSYANLLFQQGEYYRAITEYKRLLYFSRDADNRNFARLQIGRSFMAGGDHSGAVDYWDKLTRSGEITGDDLSLANAYRAIAYLDIDSHKPYTLQSKRIDQALSIIDGLDRETLAYRDFHSFAQAVREYRPDNEKSPALAGGLSAIVPGAGSAYGGRYIEATYAFLLTGLFLYATLDSYQTSNKEYVPVFAFFTFAFYGGSIYAAVNGTYRYNDFVKADYLTKQRERYLIYYSRR